MPMKKPVKYRTDTWRRLEPLLESMPDNTLERLGNSIGLTDPLNDRGASIDKLLRHGGLLLCELGLTSDPSIMNGTVFSIGGLEYVIGEEGARALAGDVESARLDVLGGGKSKAFTRSELIKALSRSQDFDQLEQRG